VAIQDAISPPRRRQLHAAVLAALRAVPEADQDVTRLAHHAEEADDAAAVLRFAPAAARSAAERHATREAIAQYARALRFADGLPDAQRLSLLEAYAQVSDLSDQGTPGIAPRQEMIALARRAGDRPKEAEHLIWLAITLACEGPNAESERASEAALAALQGEPEGPAHAIVYCQLTVLRWVERDLGAAVVWGERGIALAERLGDVHSLIMGLNARGAARLVAGDVERGRADFERCLQLARDAGDDGLVAGALGDVGSALREAYRFDEADRYLTDAIAYATERDLDNRRLWAVASLALTRLFQDRWTDATDLAASVLRVPTGATGLAVTSATLAPSAVASSFDRPVYARIGALVVLGRVRSRRGDPEAAASLAEAQALSPPTGLPKFLGLLHAVRAEAAWLAGDRERTRTEARAVFDPTVQLGLRWPVGELAYWRWRTGDLTEAPAGAATPFALQIAGDWAGAAAAWRQQGCPYEAARALADGDETAVREALAEFDASVPGRTRPWRRDGCASSAPATSRAIRARAPAPTRRT